MSHSPKRRVHSSESTCANGLHSQESNSQFGSMKTHPLALNYVQQGITLTYNRPLTQYQPEKLKRLAYASVAHPPQCVYKQSRGKFMKATYNGTDVLILGYLADNMVRIGYTSVEGIATVDVVPQADVTIVN